MSNIGMIKPPEPKGVEVTLMYVFPWDLHRIWRGLTTGNWSMVCE